jgi:hypothetical protein
VREERPLRLEVQVQGKPEPGFLRTAIAHRLVGRAFVAGPEDEVGVAVARAIAEQREGRKRWR